MKGFINAKVSLPREGVRRLSVGVEGGKIVYLGEDASVVTEPFPLKENEIVCPGFIDEHIHGAAGADAMDADKEAIFTVAEALKKEGTTSFLATTMTESADDVCRALSAVKEAMDEQAAGNRAIPGGAQALGAARNCDGVRTFAGAQNPCLSSPDKAAYSDASGAQTQKIPGARILGVHLEGPFISEKHKGAQSAKYILSPSVPAFERFSAASGNAVRLVTLAAEEDENFALIRHLKNAGICASVGHSDAGYDTFAAAVEAGADAVTHTFNAQRGIHHRDIGVAGGALLTDSVYTELICDLIHVSAPAVRLLLKTKPKDKLILVTDAMRAKGLPDGVSELGGQTVYVKNGEARLADGTLAGSVLQMNVAVKNLVLRCGAAFSDAVDAASINPAEHLGIAADFGSIAIGKHADFCVLDENFAVKLTVRGGEIIYRA